MPRAQTDEELGSVGVWTCVSHGEQERFVVLELKTVQEKQD